MNVDGITFRFPEGWDAQQYDCWAFYRDQWSRMRDGIKAVDVLAWAPDKVAWFIEVKDYRVHARTKPTSLPEEVAAKVFDTLAALLSAALGATAPEERRLARRVLEAKKVRVVLHLEQPARTSKLFPRIDPANVQQKLRQILKPVDAHPIVVDLATPTRVPWSAR